MREEDLAKDLKLHSKQLRRTLRFFEEEKLVTRDHRKEVSIAFGSVMYIVWRFYVLTFQYLFCRFFAAIVLQYIAAVFLTLHSRN